MESNGNGHASLKLDLGCGIFRRDGYIPIDRKVGKEVYPLAYPDGVAEEIRASHVLEHFGHMEVEPVLKDWVRVLKPGGKLRLAVPDFAYIAEGYLKGKKEPFASYLFGGQLDDSDYHKTAFDEDRLAMLMDAAGLKDIRRWESDTKDCAALPCSLNLEGVKTDKLTLKPLPRVAAVMSMPRLAFSDNMFSALGVCSVLGIPFERVTGAYWGQCLERVLEPYVVNDDFEYVMTVDYDTIFSAEIVQDLCALMVENPHVDALAPIQVKREDDSFLLGVIQEDGQEFPAGKPVEIDHFRRPLVRARWAHFGLTLIRLSALKKLKKPWFWSEPNENGQWGEGRIDDDIYFWRKWRDTGNTLYLASQIAIGHAQLVFTWPANDGGQIHQFPTQFNDTGRPPREVWR